MVVSVSEVKKKFSKIMRLLEKGEEKEVIVCSRGKPIMRMTPVASSFPKKRPFGILKGKYPNACNQDFFALDDEIADDFEGE